MTTPATTCRACTAERVLQKNDEAYVFCLADCLAWSLEDVLKGLCMLHRVKLGVMKVIAERGRGSKLWPPLPLLGSPRSRSWSGRQTRTGLTRSSPSTRRRPARSPF